jgi:hypothetical protein
VGGGVFAGDAEKKDGGVEGVPLAQPPECKSHGVSNINIQRWSTHILGDQLQ